MFLNDFWYVAAYSREIGQDLFARRILDEPVVLYRRADGGVAALADRCAHRGVSLSLGRRVGERIQCIYHGLEFDSTGACVRIPGTDRIPAMAGVKSYRTCERDGFVWIWMGRAEAADEKSVPDYAMASSAAFVGRPNVTHIGGSYLLNLDNALDPSHLAYLHQSTIGMTELADFPPTVTQEGDRVVLRRVMPDVANAPLFAKASGLARVDRVQTITYWPGANILAHTQLAPVGSNDPRETLNMYGVAPITPETATSHFWFFSIYRDFALDDDALTDVVFDQIQTTILEDKLIMENQQANMGDATDALGALRIPYDGAPLTMRRTVARLAETARAQAAE